MVNGVPIVFVRLGFAVSNSGSLLEEIDFKRSRAGDHRPWRRAVDPLRGRSEAQTRHRLTEEIARLGGRYAHVREESIDTRHDNATGEAWLHGRFGYTLYR